MSRRDLKHFLLLRPSERLENMNRVLLKEKGLEAGLAFPTGKRQHRPSSIDPDLSSIQDVH